MSQKNAPNGKTRQTVAPKTRLKWAGRIAMGLVLSSLFLINTQDGNPGKSIKLEGKDGELSLSAVDTVLNQYTALTVDASSGDVSLTVNDVNELDNGAALGVDDLILIMQMQGASISTDNDSSFGAISAYNNAGHYEFAYVSGTSGNQITLSCGLEFDYTATGHAQVIRVPQYTQLTIQAGGSVVAEDWDGTTGGVVAVVAENVIQVDGSISVVGKGFRGGSVDNNTNWNRREYAYSSSSYGGEKGEGIAGYQTEYDALSARYGRGAAANGGGGGNAHNAGGGGGANGNNGVSWNGQGNMCQSCTGAAAWALDSGYIKYGNTYTTSSGGGRGGYSYGSSNQDALTLAPESSSWGGDRRRQIGGFGGRPVANNPGERLFMGGGGGAGDGNNNAATGGADGGGVVILISDEISGAGSINASGADAPPTTSGHNDAPGGGGGGGVIVLKANQASTLSLQANGGAGGNQLITNNESEGPGGGGGGGYIAIPVNASVSTSVDGGVGGTSTSASVTEFPNNGATDGGAGEVSLTLTYIPFCSYTDTDGDNVPDEVDLDDDNDGIPDWVELGCTVSDFGTVACPDPAEKTASGIPRYQDATACAGGSLVNGVCPEYDFDRDGIPDFLDKDSDNDGIPDLIEAGGTDESGAGLVDCFSRSNTQYSVSLTVTDAAGNTASTTEVISLGTAPPAARYTVSPGFVSSSLSITLDATTSTDNVSISTYSWDLGDGNSATGSSVSHTYGADGSYTVKLTTTDNEGLTDTYSQVLVVSDGDPCDFQQGSILREYWSGISGTSLSNLTGSANYPDNPTSTSYLTSFSGPVSLGNNYGTRVRGYIFPPTTGDYYFTVTADDHVSVYLSTDTTEGNKTEICGHTGWTSVGQTTKYSSQRSSAIALTGGEAYYIELLHKEGGGGDHFDVYWETPDNATPTIIDGSYLAPFAGECANQTPHAVMSASPTYGSHPLSVSFTGTASTDYEGAISSYAWSFGDGTTATGASTSHSFSAPLALTDSDGDGWCDTYDAYDNGGSGYSGGVELPYRDSDQDGQKDFQDLDADNDGITDVFESGNGDQDTDQDGMLGTFASLPTDTDGDGLADLVDPADGSGGSNTGTAALTTGADQGNGRPASYTKGDTDGDGVPDYRDADADGDCIADWMEAQASGSPNPTDGLTAPAGTDTDGDGLDDAFDEVHRTSGASLGGTLPSPLDTDNDDTYDYLDTDSDDDTILDSVEGHDADQDGSADVTTSGADVDGDGLDDAYDTMTDINDANYATQNAGASLAGVQDTDNANERDWREANSPIAMPVEWLYFTGKMVNGSALLSWATSAEVNSFYYDVERSEDGQSFVALDQVQAIGFAQSKTEYSFTDISLQQIQAPSVVYRLKQVDLDGAFEYSNLVELALENGLNTGKLIAYPNPAKGATTLSLQTPEAGNWQLQVVNLSGQIMFQQAVSTSGGRSEVPLNCENWAAGFYVVHARQGQQQLTFNLQVMK